MYIAGGNMSLRSNHSQELCINDITGWNAAASMKVF